MRTEVQNSSLKTYTIGALGAAEGGDFQGAVQALYKDRNQPNFHETHHAIARIFARNIGGDDVDRMQIYCQINSEMEKLNKIELHHAKFA